ncbi:hypothetical protein EV361DRAFT_971482 [Lentinula raphanica]|uniref:WIBG Mago-binding domain-containing protein n=1 Tax=Lentinula raphanica TaxID=153919 RepID=A0AA38P5L4_9AGAR|nr:hypothetical protein FB446DRAFT_688381 [Lentinula raphanica]KAJ3824579.1 hypothetical protein F5880DRAFT_1623163 [Lentinula raphanica]KAJ3836768.1 hypothetical protein F5878DRAFT_643276 [Lentinula raphanica]KAJ3971278.1 hypothetical protein EV361DRAFT_971482 [Lentinula raphanica]
MSKSSLPPIDPTTTASGIAVDPQTLERVIPESRRADGSVRKQLKIRPGFTPQEDVRRFRGTKQAQMDANALPKGHIIGWTPPPSKQADPSKPLSKSAKKNAKRREKKASDKNVEEPVKDNWEDDVDEASPVVASTPKDADTTDSKEAPSTDTTESLSSKMEKLDVR